MNLVSVIVPVYKVEPYLEKCLDSICSQSYKNLEIICVNDGSSDNSWQILQEYAAKDNRVILVERLVDIVDGRAGNKKEPGTEFQVFVNEAFSKRHVIFFQRAGSKNLATDTP